MWNGIRKTDPNGFSLLEMAFIIAVTGLLMTAVLSLLRTHHLIFRNKVTHDHQHRVHLALEQFLMLRGRLPCPCYPDKNGNVTGIEDTRCWRGAPKEGMIPFVTLGLPEHVAKDGNYRWMGYLVGPRAATMARTHETLCKIWFEGMRREPLIVQVQNAAGTGYIPYFPKRWTISVAKQFKRILENGLAFLIISYGPVPKPLPQSWTEEAAPAKPLEEGTTPEASPPQNSTEATAIATASAVAAAVPAPSEMSTEVSIAPSEAPAPLEVVSSEMSKEGSASPEANPKAAEGTPLASKDEKSTKEVTPRIPTQVIQTINGKTIITLDRVSPNIVLWRSRGEMLRSIGISCPDSGFFDLTKDSKDFPSTKPPAAKE